MTIEPSQVLVVAIVGIVAIVAIIFGRDVKARAKLGSGEAEFGTTQGDAEGQVRADGKKKGRRGR